MRAPQPAGDDVAVFVQGAAVVLDTGPQQFGAVGNFAFHFREQRVADVDVERRRVGVTRGGARHRDAAAGAFMQTERIVRARKLQIDEMKPVRNHKADGARQLLGDILQPQPDQVAQLQAAHHRGAHRHGTGADAVFLVARQINQLAHPGQSVGQSRHRRSRQPAAIGDLQVAEPRLVALEAAQHVESARNHLNNVALACEIAGEHSLLAEPFRASSHVWYPLSFRLYGIKFHLLNKLPQAICGHNSKPWASARSRCVCCNSRICAAAVPEEWNARNQDCDRSRRARLRASR